MTLVASALTVILVFAAFFASLFPAALVYAFAAVAAELVERAVLPVVAAVFRRPRVVAWPLCLVPATI